MSSRVIWVDCSTKIAKKSKPARVRRKRLVWSEEMENQFIKSVNKLGVFATPTTILLDMNFPGLTRGQVSSHLQQHRLKQKVAPTSMDKLSLQFLIN